MINLPKIIRTKAAHITGIEESTVRDKVDRTGSVGRCTKCPRAIDHKTRNYCEECNCWVCPKHFS